MKKFLCDAMLSGLGKWLRIAGYDTTIAEKHEEDSHILAQALKENRILLTRDKHFLEMHIPSEMLVYLSGNSIEECALELTQKIALDWTYCPFSRCLLCNSNLQEPTEEMMAAQNLSLFPLKSPRFCKHCNKLFWQGSHTEKMLKKLQTWNKFSHGT